MKPVILVFARYYLPGFLAGGPIRSIVNLVEQLHPDFEFHIVTLDRDLGTDCPYPDIQTECWTKVGKAFVYYASPSRLGMRDIAAIIQSTPHDLIYLNSFFDPRFTQLVIINSLLKRLSGRPIVLAPRGEFSVGALKLKWWKKKIFIQLVNHFDLYRSLTWQASSAHEAEDIRRAITSVRERSSKLVVSGNITVAPDLTGGQAEASCARPSFYEIGPNFPLRVCFLSRISPKKNLEFALRAMSLVCVPARFVIYGPIEDATYWATCQALIGKMPSNVEVVHAGAIEYQLVLTALAHHEVFLFPTCGENYGHVIHEALRAGLLLLISDQTPWKQLELKGVGWDLPLGKPEAFARRIEEVAGWSVAMRQQAVERAHALANQVGANPETLEANRKMFRAAIIDYKAP
jgi:glycosyltransferase involved in cell wall biosynthesis